LVCSRFRLLRAGSIEVGEEAKLARIARKEG